MKKKQSSRHADPRLPVSKQTAGGVAGAVIGSVIAGPVGAVVGAVAGTLMGNRAARGEPMVSSGTVKTAKSAVQAVERKLPLLKPGKSTKTKAAPGRTGKSTQKAVTKQPASKKTPVKKNAPVKKPSRKSK